MVNLYVYIQPNNHQMLQYLCHVRHSFITQTTGEVLGGRVVYGCAAQNGRFFHPSGFTVASYFFENVVSLSGAFFILDFSVRIGCKKKKKKVKFVLKFIDQKVQRTFGLNVGCKFGSSVVLLSGGSQNFQPQIQTKKNLSTHPQHEPSHFITWST